MKCVPFDSHLTDFGSNAIGSTQQRNECKIQIVQIYHEVKWFKGSCSITKKRRGKTFNFMLYKTLLRYVRIINFF